MKKKEFPNKKKEFTQYSKKKEKKKKIISSFPLIYAVNVVWGHIKKTKESEKQGIQGCLVVLKGRKIR